MMRIEKRRFVRIVSFFTAAVIVLGILSITGYSKAGTYKTQLEYGYSRAVEDLSASIDNIRNTLNKGMYAYSAEMMSELSSKLWSDASAAKVSLSLLPVEQLHLENTNKFLSQVGNYAKSLSVRYSNGEQLTEEDLANVDTLYDFAVNLAGEMWKVEKQVQNGDLSFEETASVANDSGTDDGSATVTSGFSEFEGGFDNYPSLIYDGPFSDHLLTRTPLMTEGERELSATEALQRAIDVTGISTLTQTGEERGNMPCYVFSSDNATVAMTKKGGFFAYMLNYRSSAECAITAETATENAKKYLAALGMTAITETYYEIENNVCILNFAGSEDNVTYYTDLIKVGVAMDTGEIIAYDARGYITNHTERELLAPKITEEEAQKCISPALDIKKTSLCVIPSESVKEKFCYEFLCNGQDGGQVLVYVNAMTGCEEEILLLKISGGGVLTV